MNGAAAHLVKPHDLVIICSYVQVDEAEAAAGRRPASSWTTTTARATEDKAIPSAAI